MNRKSKMYSKKVVMNLACGDVLMLEDVQERMLQMMIVFDEFCKNHGIRYYLAGGTLIGAIRHKGFIPWDDDVDILVPREDYERLIKYNSINDELDIVSYVNMGDYYHPYPYCNIADRKTVMLEHHARNMTGKGIFLDVFPLDNVPNDMRERKTYYKRLMFWRYVKGIQSSPYRKIRGIKDLIFNSCSFLFTPLDEMKLVKKIDELAQKYRYSQTSDCAQLLVINPEKVTWSKDDYKEVMETKFETGTFMIPVKYDNVLRKQYGNYMELPPERERVGLHGVDVYLRKENKINSTRKNEGKG